MVYYHLLIVDIYLQCCIEYSFIVIVRLVSQALQYVDQLKELISQQPNAIVDHPDILGILQAMYCFTIVPIGRDALVRVLAEDLQPLIDLISATG